MENCKKAPILPDYPTAFDRVTVEGNSEMLYAAKTDEAAFRAYLQALEQAGYVLYTRCRIGQSLFATYTMDEWVLMCSFDPTNATVRIIPDRTAVLPLRAEDPQLPQRFDQALLTQLRLNNLNNDCGMCYTLRLKDGRFLLFDGGCRDHGDEIKLYELMKSQCLAGEEPVIAAWFLSHAHGDHYDNFFALMERYGDRIRVEMMVYNLPATAILLQQTHEEYEARLKPIESIQAPTVYARTGQRFFFGDTLVETLLTPDDFYPEQFKASRENDFSVVFRIACDGQAIMMLGDTEKNGSAALVRRYGSYLKSDIMQKAHHGFWAGSVELYQAISPETVIWPCPFQWYYNLYNGNCGCASNEYLHKSETVKEILLSSEATYVLALPYHPAKANRPEAICHTYATGEVISHADFAAIGYLYELGWSYLNTNDWNEPSFRYDEPSLELTEKNGKRGVRITGNKYAVVNVVRPELLRGNDTYTLELEADIEARGDGFSVWYNDTQPVSRRDRCLYTVNRTGPFALTLKVDRKNGTTAVYSDGKHIETLTNDCNDAGGIQLLLQSTTAFVTKLTLKAGV